MRAFVLDCSATMAFFFKDEASSYTDAVFEALATDARAVVPPIWPLEVANVCLTAERKKRIDSHEISEILSILETFPIAVDESSNPKTVRDILALARKHHLTAYDAAYLELAMRHGLPLATLDKKLKQAAHKANIPLWRP